MYTGVGARRIRETFEMLRNFAPAVLFVDEFDALGAARGAAAAGDESASIINELLVQVRNVYEQQIVFVLYFVLQFMHDKKNDNFVDGLCLAVWAVQGHLLLGIKSHSHKRSI